MSRETPAPAPPASADAGMEQEQPNEKPTPPPPPEDGVSPCSGNATVFVVQLAGDRASVKEIELNGRLVRTWVEHQRKLRPGIDVTRKLAVDVDGLRDVEKGTVTPIPEAERWVWPVFVPGKPWIVSPLADADPPEIEVFDFSRGKVAVKLSGDAPSLSPAGTLFYLEPARSHVVIRRYRNGKSEKVKTIELNEEGGPYDVTEVVPFSDHEFVYRVYDEHEYRYYDRRDRPFSLGSDGGHYADPETGEINQGPSKEQFDLTVSLDRKHVAFTERNWNELTYLVVVDRRSKRRTQTSYYGSFPAIYGEFVLSRAIRASYAGATWNFVRSSAL